MDKTAWDGGMEEGNWGYPAISQRLAHKTNVIRCQGWVWASTYIGCCAQDCVINREESGSWLKTPRAYNWEERRGGHMGRTTVHNVIQPLFFFF